MKKRIRCFLVFTCLCAICSAQQVVSSGGYVKQPEASVDWIIGGSLSDISGIDLNYLASDQMRQLMESGSYVNIFPNPVNDLINIEIASSDTGRITLELIDLQGKTLISRTVTSEPLIQLDIKELADGSYYLKIARLSDEGLFRIEKIIKVKK